MEQESPLQTEATPRSFPRANRSPLDTTPSGCSERLCRPRCSFSDHTASCPVFLVNQVPVLVLPEFVTLRSRAEPPPHTPLPTRLPFPSCPPPPPDHSNLPIAVLGGGGSFATRLAMEGV